MVFCRCGLHLCTVLLRKRQFFEKLIPGTLIQYQMKTIFAVSLILSFMTAPAWSQHQMKTNLAITAVNMGEWQPAPNWLEAYRNAFGKAAGTQWISELALEGTFLQNRKTGGLLIVLPDHLSSFDQMKSILAYGIFEGKDTRLMPLTGEMNRSQNLCFARFLGQLEGVPASLDLAVIQQDGSYLTVMGFYPGNELTNEFSGNFEQTVSRAFKNQPLANR